jgi:hypothetical protein
MAWTFSKLCKKALNVPSNLEGFIIRGDYSLKGADFK